MTPSSSPSYTFLDPASSSLLTSLAYDSTPLFNNAAPLPPQRVNMVRSMWLFKHKFHADVTLSRYKAHLVANGSSQQLGVDFGETFSLILKSATIRTVLSLAVPLVLLTLGYATWAGFYHSRCDSSLFIYRQGLFLSQKKYALQLLERTHMVNCNPSRTPVDTESKLDLSYAVQQICLYMHDPREPHFAALKRCPSTRKSTSGYYVFLGDNLLSWSAKLQHTLSRSSVEAKYHGVAYVVAKTDWLRNLLRELQSPLSTATFVYCDNVSAIYMSANPVQHQQTKHIELDIHFFRDMVTTGQVRVLHVPSRYQYAAIFTKGLPSALFGDFLSSLSVCHPPT
ncbi:ribonuclease H-like domain-containing protein [Tanacetum coccineum]